VLVGHKLSTLTDGAAVQITEEPAPIEGESESTKSNAMEAR
jgi:hypothetical protein